MKRVQETLNRIILRKTGIVYKKEGRKHETYKSATKYWIGETRTTLKFTIKKQTLKAIKLYNTTLKLILDEVNPNISLNEARYASEICSK